MLHYSRWKTLAILGTVLLAIFVALPNLLPAGVNEKLAPYGLRPLTLGLDLQGGSNVLLEVDRADLKQKLGKQLTGDIRSALREAKIGYQGINVSADGVTVRISKPEDLEKARVELDKLKQPQEMGIFATGQTVYLFDMAEQGQVFSFTYSDEGIEAKVASAVTQVLKIVESRINALGTTEPVIQQQGKDRIIVQVPGLQDPDRVKDLVGRTAKLTFQLLCEDQPTATSKTPPGECEDLKANDAELPPNMWVQTSSRATVDGADLVDARPAFDQNNQPVVSFRFNTKGAEKFARLTRENVGKPFAIVLDEEIVSAPAHQRTDPRRLGPDFRQFHHAGNLGPRHRAALRRAAGETYDCRRTHCWPQPRIRFDPRRPHRLGHRPRACAGLLPWWPMDCLASSPTSRFSPTSSCSSP